MSAVAVAPATPPVLVISGLTVGASGLDVPVVRDVDVIVGRGEVMCVVGESGSGKSMTAYSVMGLLPLGLASTAGSVLVSGGQVLGASRAELNAWRGTRMGMIFQEPMTALNPVLTVRRQISETFRYHRPGMSKAEISIRLEALLADVHLPAAAVIADRYPHQLSGGQRQRVMIAMAMALEPALLIADEPTTALDVTTQKQILTLIRDLVRRRSIGVLLITHDFGVVAEIADRVTVMRSGIVVESGEVGAVLKRPRQPYTRALLDAVPRRAPANARTLSDVSLLKVRDLKKSYESTGGLFRRGPRALALKEVSFDLSRSEVLGVVGESGSGKSTLARCIARLHRPDAGEIRLDQTDIASLSERRLRPIRKRIQIVFQDPYRSLNPRMRVGRSLLEGAMNFGLDKACAQHKVRDLLELVGLDKNGLDRLPHEFSGGQRQRLCIARALACGPDLLIADEAVSALDVSVQAQVLALLSNLREQLGLAILFITHDLRVARQLCDRLIVMRDGQIVEQGVTGQLFDAPRDSYTRELLAAAPRFETALTDDREPALGSSSMA